MGYIPPAPPLRVRLWSEDYGEGICGWCRDLDFMVLIEPDCAVCLKCYCKAVHMPRRRKRGWWRKPRLEDIVNEYVELCEFALRYDPLEAMVRINHPPDDELRIPQPMPGTR